MIAGLNPAGVPSQLRGRLLSHKMIQPGAAQGRRTMSMFSRSTGTAGGYQTGMNGPCNQALPGWSGSACARGCPPAQSLSLAACESSLAPARGVKAVEDVSLALRPGRSTALVGESGSGKTTVARLLARLYGITSGEYSLSGPGGRWQELLRHAQAIAAMCS